MRTTGKWGWRWLALGFITVVGVAVPGAASAAALPTVQSVAPWKQNAAPMGWSASLNRVIYNSRGADGMFDAYSANPDGSGPQCLTCALPSFPGVGSATNRGASDVAPDGRYMLLEVESGTHAGQIGGAISEPGKGTYNDVWLATTDGSQAWPLTSIASTGALGTMWARFDRTGTRIVWAELYSPAIFNLGYWRLKVADIVWSGGVPSLANIQTIEPAPGHFYEPYGFTPDDSHIIFASDAGMPSWWDSQIYSIATDGTGLTRLSPADTPTGFFSDYNEFAFYLPDNSAIVYGRTVGASKGGMDYWVMNPDGTGSQRLTYFNEPWNTEYLGYTVVGGLAFDPNDPNRFVTAVATDVNAQNLNAVIVTLNASAAPPFTGQYFSDTGFTQLVATRAEDPTGGFKWNGPPAPGMPSSDYAVRWTGAVDPTVSGSYTFCAVADSGMRLWVGGVLLVDGWLSFGRRGCATATLQAGVPTSIRLDYWHGFGTAYIQLSEVPPTSPGPGPGSTGSPGAPTPPATVAASASRGPASRRSAKRPPRSSARTPTRHATQPACRRASRRAHKHAGAAKARCQAPRCPTRGSRRSRKDTRGSSRNVCQSPRRASRR